MANKCTCGAAKTYGEDTTLHADYCDALKPEPPEETSYPTTDDDDNKWPWVTWDRWTMAHYSFSDGKLTVKPLDIKDVIR